MNIIDILLVFVRHTGTGHNKLDFVMAYAQF